MSIRYYEDKKLWVLETMNTSYVMGVDDEGNLHNVYWGAKLPLVTDYPLPDMKTSFSSFDTREGMANLEYPAWGGALYTEPCLKVTFADHVRVLSLKYAGFDQFNTCNSPVGNSPEEGAPELVIELKDSLAYGLYIMLHVKVYEAFDIIEKYVEVKNNGIKPVTLENVQSAVWYLPRGINCRMTHLTGKWAGETQVRQTMLTEGKTVLESRRGTTSAHLNPWLALDQGNADEDHGDVWFAALGWSGNWKISVEQTTFKQLKITGGINDFDFAWHLEPGGTFRTPVFTAGYTEKGFGQASRLMHSYQFKHVLPEKHAGKLRKVLYNSWEATYFNVNEKDQLALAEKAAALGVELFVIDDGWFGTRNSDSAGLGDWYVNEEKFPDGLSRFIQKINELGMEFGIWVEPEMVNPDSELYRKHPDWVYHFPSVPCTQARNQLVLNLAVDEVREYLYDVLDRLLGENNISFIKWDMNRHFTEPGWPEAPVEKQRELWVRHTWNVYEIVDRLKQKYPQVVFEACSGGGGRIDLGILRHMDQFWPSDNTDAFDRLKIQEGYSQAYCTKAMMAWVTDSPNYLNRRELSLEYRFHSAMMGVLGIGGNLNHWSEDELNTARKMIRQYKEIRNIIQEGLLYRLISPRQGNLTAVEYTNIDGSEAVVFIFLHSSSLGEKLPVIYLKGLEETASYRSEILDEPLSGAALMKRGITVDLRGDFKSRIVKFFKLP